MTERIGPITKIDEFVMNTAWGDTWKVTILGDKKTNGMSYVEAHIKGVDNMSSSRTRDFPTTDR